jgi:hypothetical protein
MQAIQLDMTQISILKTDPVHQINSAYHSNGELKLKHAVIHLGQEDSSLKSTFLSFHTLLHTLSINKQVVHTTQNEPQPTTNGNYNHTYKFFFLHLILKEARTVLYQETIVNHVTDP